MIPYSFYIELIQQVYPNAYKKIASGKPTTHIWIDTRDSWRHLPDAIKEQVIDSLLKQKETGRLYKDG